MDYCAFVKKRMSYDIQEILLRGQQSIHNVISEV